MHSEVAKLPLLEESADCFLLIPSRFPPVDLYERLAPESANFAKLEELTNPRLRSKRILTEQGDGEDANSPRLQNWNHAPFAYTNPEGSWFFDCTVPCLEMSLERQTALAVSVRRREQFLMRTREAPINLDMRMLVRRVRGRALDARSLFGETDRAKRLAIGHEMLVRREHDPFDAVLFASQERPSGRRIAVLSGSILDRAVQSDHYRYSWNGERIVSLYAFNSNASTGENVINPDDLCEAANVLAA